MPQLTGRIGGFVLLSMLGCSALWAYAFILIKQLDGVLDPITLAGVRGTIGAIGVAIWIAIRGSSPLPRVREWRDFAILGVLQGVIPNTLTIIALARLSTGATAMVQSLTPLLVAGAASWMLPERLTWTRRVGIGLGLTGTLLLVAPATIADGRVVIGYLLMLVVATSYAAGNLYVQKVGGAPERLAFGQQAFSGVPCLIVAAGMHGGLPLAQLTEHAPKLMLLGAVGTALPIVLYMFVLTRGGALVGSMNSYLLPMWASLFGALLLGEVIGMIEVGAFVLIIAGVGAVSRASTSKDELHDRT